MTMLPPSFVMFSKTWRQVGQQGGRGLPLRAGSHAGIQFTGLPEGMETCPAYIYMYRGMRPLAWWPEV